MQQSRIFLIRFPAANSGSILIEEDVLHTVLSTHVLPKARNCCRTDPDNPDCVMQALMSFDPALAFWSPLPCQINLASLAPCFR